jgi:hypothetical protein
MKHILCYLHGTPDFGLLLRHSSISDLIIYTDADWAGCPDIRRSTLDYVVFLRDNLVSWSTKRPALAPKPSIVSSPMMCLRPPG